MDPLLPTSAYPLSHCSQLPPVLLGIHLVLTPIQRSHVTLNWPEISSKATQELSSHTIGQSFNQMPFFRVKVPQSLFSALFIHLFALFLGKKKLRGHLSLDEWQDKERFPVYWNRANQLCNQPIIGFSGQQGRVERALVSCRVNVLCDFDPIPPFPGFQCPSN